MVSIRPMIMEDYRAIAGYWEAYGKPINPAMLYPSRTSYVLEENGEIVYAIALHKIVGLPGGYVGGLVRNPQTEPDDKQLRKLFSYMENQAKMLGCKALMGSAENEYLANRYKDLGYNRLVGQYFVVTKELI